LISPAVASLDAAAGGIAAMLRYLVRRLIQTVPILLAVAAVIFILFSVIPGTFASSLGDDGKAVMDAEIMERMNREFGLADPIHVRFAKYVVQLAQFDLGTSFRTRQPVATMIAVRMWPSLQLAFASMALAIVIGVPLGFVAALKPGSAIDLTSMILAVSGLSLPKFWLGLLLMYLFALKLGWFPSFGYGDGNLKYLVLPAVALGVSPLALLARTTRAAVLEIMNADFVRTARSKGMSETRVVRWHLVRNALVIVLTTVGLQFGSVIGQAVVVEKLFAWPGLGSLLVESVSLRDIPVVQGCILTIVLFFLIINLAVDVVCAMIDPRIKYS
jgi:peptide/nickel transport system permease protein